MLHKNVNGSLRSCSARQPFNYSVMLYIDWTSLTDDPSAKQNAVSMTARTVTARNVCKNEDDTRYNIFQSRRPTFSRVWGGREGGRMWMTSSLSRSRESWEFTSLEFWWVKSSRVLNFCCQEVTKTQRGHALFYYYWVSLLLNNNKKIK